MTEKQKADLDTLVLQTTHALWYTQINKILCYALDKTIINSEQLYQILELFDPIENHKVGRL